MHQGSASVAVQAIPRSRPQRSEPRHKRRCPVRFSTGGPSHWAFTRDVGRQGLSIETKHVEPPGTLVHVDIDLPDGGAASFVGEVIWANKTAADLVRVARGGIGLRILNAPREWTDFIGEIEHWDER